MASAVPRNEARRLASLRALQILDTAAEQELDDIAMLASEMLEVPIALISFLDAERQWFKAKVGMASCEVAREAALCAHAILEEEMLVVPDATKDPRFADNPLVLGAPHIRFYAGAPIHLSDGSAVGTLCIIDVVSRELTPRARSMLLALKRQVEALLALRQNRHELVELQQKKDMLVQFLVHDMKNALASVVLNAQSLIEESSSPGEVRDAAHDIELAGAALHRLVFDIMDVSRSERGGLLVAQRKRASLDAIVADVARRFARRLADARVTLQTPPSGLRPHVDAALLERVLENLLDNAVRNSPAGAEVVVSASHVERENEIVLVVADHGPGVAPTARAKIFELYEQSPDSRSGAQGIGLAFCRLAAEAHGGRIWVEPNRDGGSRFCVAF